MNTEGFMNEAALQHCSAYEIVMIVHELHKRGYEQIRLFPGLSPSGLSWRWMIYPKVLMGEHNQHECNDDCVSFRCLRGSTGETSPKSRPLITVNDIYEGNEDFFRLGKGVDPEYTTWFNTIVNHAQKEDFPIGFADFCMEEQWAFSSSGEKLPYPPFSPASIDQLPDDLMIEYAQCTFDPDSLCELHEVLTFDGVKPSVQIITNTIRQAVKEGKSLISHYESAYDKILAYSANDISSEEKTKDGLRVTFNNGEVVNLCDEIDFFAWKKE